MLKLACVTVSPLAGTSNDSDMPLPDSIVGCTKGRRRLFFPTRPFCGFQRRLTWYVSYCWGGPILPSTRQCHEFNFHCELITKGDSVFVFCRPRNCIINGNMPDEAWKVPFPDTPSAEAEDVFSAVPQICSALRSNHVYWRYLVQHCPLCVGSLAQELVVILDDQNRPHVLKDSMPGTYIRACLRAVLHRNGASARPAARMADAVAAHIMTVNTLTLQLCSTLTQRTDDRYIVLRVAIKAAALIVLNPVTQKVWFRAGHANVAIINTAYNNIILVEPTGRVIIQSLDLLLLRTLIHTEKQHLFQVFTNFNMQTQAPDDNLCTVWCALYGLLCLANGVTSQMQLYAMLEWVALRRAILLRLFLKHARRSLSL